MSALPQRYGRKKNGEPCVNPLWILRVAHDAADDAPISGRKRAILKLLWGRYSTVDPLGEVIAYPDADTIARQVQATRGVVLDDLEELERDGYLVRTYITKKRDARTDSEWDERGRQNHRCYILSFEAVEAIVLTPRDERLERQRVAMAGVNGKRGGRRAGSGPKRSRVQRVNAENEPAENGRVQSVNTVPCSAGERAPCSADEKSRVHPVNTTERTSTELNVTERIKTEPDFPIDSTSYGTISTTQGKPDPSPQDNEDAPSLNNVTLSPKGEEVETELTPGRVQRVNTERTQRSALDRLRSSSAVDACKKLAREIAEANTLRREPEEWTGDFFDADEVA